MSLPTPPPEPAVIGGFLRHASDQYDTARTRRVEAIRLARAAGLSFRQIGHDLGISEAAVRGLLKRYEVEK